MISFIVLVAFSAWWSPAPEVTVRRAFSLFANLLFALAVAQKLTLTEATRSLTHAGVAGCALSIIWAMWFPPIGTHQGNELVGAVHSGLWRGIYVHKNGLGSISALTLLLLLIHGRQAFNSRVALLGAVLATVVCIVMSSSATAIGVTAFGYALWAATLSINRTSPQERPIRLLALTALLIMNSIIVSAGANVVFELLGRTTDLSGRIPLWDTLWGVASANGPLGFGYSTGFQLILAPYAATRLGFTPASAHNMFLEVYLAVGWLGALWLIFFTYSAVRRWIKSTKSNRRDAIIATVVMMSTVFANLFESFLLIPGSMHTVAFFICWCCLKAQKNFADQ